MAGLCFLTFFFLFDHTSHSILIIYLFKREKPFVFVISLKGLWEKWMCKVSTCCCAPFSLAFNKPWVTFDPFLFQYELSAQPESDLTHSSTQTQTQCFSMRCMPDYTCTKSIWAEVTKRGSESLTAASRDSGYSSPNPFVSLLAQTNCMRRGSAWPAPWVGLRRRLSP